MRYIPLNGFVDEGLKAFCGLQMREAIETGRSRKRTNRDGESTPFLRMENQRSASAHHSPHHTVHAASSLNSSKRCARTCLNMLTVTHPLSPKHLTRTRTESMQNKKTKRIRISKMIIWERKFDKLFLQFFYKVTWLLLIKFSK